MAAPAPRPRALRAVRAALAAGVVAAALAWIVPFASAAAEVSADGTAAGALAKGSTVKIRLQVTNSAGWQRIEDIMVTLRLRGQPLDQVVVVPSTFSISVVNSGPPVTIGEPGPPLQGPYFKLDNAKAGVRAKGNTYHLTFPMQLTADPPPGASLILGASDTSGVAADEVALTPPVVPKEKGIPWGTIGLAVAAALFFGAFVGNTFSTRRARARPNVYATVARRLDEDRAKRDRAER